MVHQFLQDPLVKQFLVGFEDVFNVLDHTAVCSYPPFNIIKVDDDNFKIDVACTGFEESEIKVTQDRGNSPSINIVAKKEKSDTKINYQHKGLSTKDFTRTVGVDQYMDIENVWLKNGVLTVEVKRNLPEDQKPKTWSPNSNPQPLNEG